MTDIKDLKNRLNKYFVKGPKLDEVAYELLFSSNMEEDLRTLDRMHTEGAQPLAREFILAMQSLEPVRTRVLENYDLNIRSTSMMEGTLKCKYCSSTDTMYTVRQTRASDEAPTRIVFCNSCGRRSTGEDS